MTDLQALWNPLRQTLMMSAFFLTFSLSQDPPKSMAKNFFTKLLESQKNIREKQVVKQSPTLWRLRIVLVTLLLKWPLFVFGLRESHFFAAQEILYLGCVEVGGPKWLKDFSRWGSLVFFSLTLFEISRFCGTFGSSFLLSFFLEVSQVEKNLYECIADWRLPSFLFIWPGESLAISLNTDHCR